MAAPIVTFCIVNYNQSQFVAQCFDSVRAQKIDGAEYIVIDDCSTDNSVNFITTYIAQHNWGVNFIANKHNKGIAQNLHDAVLLATGKYFAFLAADDFIDEGRTQLLIEKAMAHNHEHAIYITNHRLVDENNQLIAEDGLGYFHPALKEKRVSNRAELFEQEKCLSYFIEFSYIPSLANLVKRDAILQCGNYQVAYKVEDFPLWLKLLSHYTIYYHDEVLANYRQVPSSYSRKNGHSILWDESFFVLAPYLNNKLVKNIVSKKLLYFFLRDAIQNKKFDSKKWPIVKNIHWSAAIGYVLKELGSAIKRKM